MDGRRGWEGGRGVGAVEGGEAEEADAMMGEKRKRKGEDAGGE